MQNAQRCGFRALKYTAKIIWPLRGSRIAGLKIDAQSSNNFRGFDESLLPLSL
jgi:hypothetical protein